MEKTKENRRIQYTKTVVKQSFFQLLTEKPIEKITVKELCQKAGINRGTFYSHYCDIYDLREKLETEMEEKIDACIENIEINTIADISIRILNILLDNKDFCQAILGKHGDKAFLNHMINHYSKNIFLFWKDLHNNCSEVQLQWISSFIIHGSSSIISCWIEQGMKEPPEKITEFIMSFCKKGSESFL